VPEKGAIELESGLGLVTRIVVDQHFAQRGRLPRLLSIIAEHPDLYGIGIDEDTALVICPGERIEIVGAGGITFVDGRTMLSNLADIEKHASPRLVDVRLHVLPTGTKFTTKAVDGPELPPAPFEAFFNALIERQEKNVHH
jgi:cyanophycinase